MPGGWLHVGCLKDVPLWARFKGHAGGTWVWVMPEDSESFAQFTLVMNDIATLNIDYLYAPPILVTLTKYKVTELPEIGNEKNQGSDQLYRSQGREARIQRGGREIGPRRGDEEQEGRSHRANGSRTRTCTSTPARPRAPRRWRA